MKGRKCSIIFMRKVASRLTVLEERYKDKPHQERAKLINEQMLEEFCVGEREIKRWKSIVKVATRDDINVILPPTHLMEIVRLPEEKQRQVIEEVANKNLFVDWLKEQLCFGSSNKLIAFLMIFLND